jgi:hypothetical protein
MSQAVFKRRPVLGRGKGRGKGRGSKRGRGRGSRRRPHLKVSRI